MIKKTEASFITNGNLKKKMSLLFSLIPEKRSLVMFALAVLFSVLLVGCPAAKDKTKTTPPVDKENTSEKQLDENNGESSGSEKPVKATKELVMAEIWNTVEKAKSSCDLNLQKAEEFRKKILNVGEKRTEENTLKPLNMLFVHLDRMLPMAELISNTHPKKSVRKAAEECEQRAKKYASELKLDREVYDAIKAVEEKGLDAYAARFRTHILRDYRRAGVDKDEKTRKKLSEIQQKMVKLGQDFARNIREDKKSIQVTKKELAGLPDDFIKARTKDKETKITITTEYPDFFPVQAYAKDHKLRQRLYKLYLQRAYPVNEKVLKQILELRHEYATTLGFSDWADYNAEDKMVKNKKVISDFIDKVSGLAKPRMNADLKDILTRKKKDYRRARSVQSWDRFYYVKKIQAERYGVKPDEVRAYFPFKSVKEGLMKISQELFGVRFKRVEDAEVWHPKVETYDIYEGDKMIARFYLDLHPREGKYGHAAEFPILSGVNNIQVPTAALVTNFPDPDKSEHALTEHNQVTTFFHEFGHLMHQLLSGRKDWVTQSGINCEWDFVEVPSQLFEEWAWDQKVLARFAKHYETGDPIPEGLVEKMRKADEFGKGIHVMRQMFYAGLSLNYHNKDPKNMDLMKEMLAVGKRYNPYPHIKETATFASFGHLSGYSSMYYTYMWSLVISKDLFKKFQEAGLMNKEVATAYKNTIIEPGGAVDAAKMVENFLGRPYSFAAFQKWLQKN